VSGRLEPTYDPHRQSLVAADGEGTVAAPELLVGDLLAGVWVAATLAGVDDEVAEVVVVLVAAGHNDRVGAFVLAP
jgi:hypothetical protein